jgi:hypothetical protein
MHGAIVVLPSRDDFLDSFLADIDFKVGIIEHFHTGDETGVSIVSLESENEGLLTIDLEDNSEEYGVTDGLYDLRVNGLFQLKMTVTQNEWFGLRLMFTAASYSVFVTIEECEVKIVARDGVYLDEAIEENIVVMVPGNRVDIVVRCTESGTFEMQAVDSDAMQWWCAGEDYLHCFDTDITLMLFEVIAASADNSSAFPSNWTAPSKPSYL